MEKFGSDFVGATGIPSGLNRIKTLHERSVKESLLNSASDDPAKFYGGPPVPPRPVTEKEKKKKKKAKDGHGNTGFHKGKRISRWFSSYLMKDDQAAKDIHPNTKVSDSGTEMLSKESYWGTKYVTGKDLPDNVHTRKASSGFKSFSHELGPKGGIQTTPPRAYSFNDLKELLGSLHSRFDAAKGVVNDELSHFSRDVKEFLAKEHSSTRGQKEVEDLLSLAQQCTEMASAELRIKCGAIVQNLTVKRQQCQAGLMKQLFTRLLFILTRCTRLLQFENDSEPIDENSFHKFRKCLENIPAVETSWLPTANVDSCARNKFSMEDQLPKEGKEVSSLSDGAGGRSEELPSDTAKALRKDSSTLVKESRSHYPQIDDLSDREDPTVFDSRIYNSSGKSYLLSFQKENVEQCHHVDESPGNLLYKSFDDPDSVICRICENAVPSSHLESHSYVCAYADKCDLKYLEVDERLSRLAEVLEQIIESSTINNRASHASPDISRVQNGISFVGCEVQSPKVVDWHNKGVEGMFEDLHEMDTACIDDSLVGAFGNLKGHVGTKLNHYGPSSSSGSVTSISSTNTPRATNTPRTSHFDLFWLESNCASESEDVQQMIDLAELTRCIASTNLERRGASDLLLGYMRDLQDILRQSKLKALVIDTFGNRVENLLREKYLLACDVIDRRSPENTGKSKEGIRCLLDNESQSSAVSTPSHSTHRERISIEDFEIIKPISRGAYGKVFLARKRTTGDIFAIKVLKKLDMIRKNDIERILAERNILITVRNPFVVRFFYSFSCRDNLYLVMEYLNGGDLYSLIKTLGCLEEDVSRTYVAELVLALEYLHSIGIVHRDLKPDNILIAHDGHIKLTDFGLSKIGLVNNTADLSGYETNATTLAAAKDLHYSFEHTQQMEERSQGSAVGTPDYLAPEILLGTEHGCAADWWSVGIILFELITGIPPFSAESPEMIFENILNKEITWPVVPTEMSYDTQDLINRLLIHDPDQRLGANGASEVKAHPFFRGVNWDTLTSQKAAFVPNPDGVDDTSYFMPRHSQISNGIVEDHSCSDNESGTTDWCSNSELEVDEFGDLADFNSSPLDLSLINFSFKNLSQLAAINYDVLLQRDSSSSSPSRGSLP